ncbi:MAG: alpha,alpha-phosphotrehalase [Beduini sp.]|uniref:alpha,alpha-phosphotrehalase n=1 Tax=Beduini sp. TaxID=1922300 RepID=UPI0039A21CFD
MKNFKDKVIYQIYPKSFNDTNHDGIGDLNGVTEKLDYLKRLGVDMLWLTPFFVSPQNDNGYDVANYYEIDPIYGTLDDLQRLIKEAKKREIGLMFDMVFNHTSTHHEWFKKAMAGDPYYKDFYFFKKGQNHQPPTNWESKFGGNAWEYVEAFDEYYLHLFDVTQADLNWENPNVVKEMAKIVNYYLEMGITGFRFDVINLISKESFEDDFEGVGKRFYTDCKKVNDYLRELNEHSFGRCDDTITVGEMSATTIKNCVRYSKPEHHELDMTFNFHHLKVDYLNKEKWTLMPFDFMELKQLFNDWQIGMQEGGGWNALFWCCHDQPRIVSRFGNDKEYHRESAKMLATALHMMRGTPYIYQGEELGMTNAYFTDLKQYRDIESINHFHILKNQGLKDEEIYAILQSKSRDNARTPMQWDNTMNAGFSDRTPWMEVNPNYLHINVEAALQDNDSIFYHYARLIQLRKQYPVIQEGLYEPLLEDSKQVFAYLRHLESETLLVINNFYAKEVMIQLDDIEGYQLLLSNYPSQSLKKELTLRPYESCIYYRK